MSNVQFSNPILPGFFPDPSICRVGEEYWLVTSTFTYFPGVPVFHSRDLVHWEQVGHVLDRPSQLDLDGLEHSMGIFAPTLRHHKSVFYMITTLVGKGGNFIVTATNPAGPWSDPYWLEDAPGIDPSLFFDEDGTAWVTGTAAAPDASFPGDNEIWMRQLDLTTMQGPYDGNPANPILTHRHLGKSAPIWNPGHADLVQTQTGEWWLVCLASRPYGGYFRNLGRETFLAPVVWEDEWPVVSPGTGRLEFRYPLPTTGTATGFYMDADADAPSTGACGGCSGRAGGCCGTTGKPTVPGAVVPSGFEVPGARYICEHDDFDTPTLSFVWNFLRTPREPWWSLKERPGCFRMRLRPIRLGARANPCFLGRRQQHMTFTVTTELLFSPDRDGQSAGIALVQSDDWHLRLAVIRDQGMLRLRVYQVQAGEEIVLSEAGLLDAHELAAGIPRLVLRVEAEEQNLRFLCGLEESSLSMLVDGVDARMLSTDKAGGFVGTYVGLFAEGENPEGQAMADFDSFTYEGC